jgi:hypothetical protein
LDSLTTRLKYFSCSAKSPAGFFVSCALRLPDPAPAPESILADPLGLGGRERRGRTSSPASLASPCEIRLFVTVEPAKNAAAANTAQNRLSMMRGFLFMPNCQLLRISSRLGFISYAQTLWLMREAQQQGLIKISGVVEVASLALARNETYYKSKPRQHHE